MGLFDIFSKKEDPIKQLGVLKNDIQQYVLKLEKLSSSMNEQVEIIKGLPTNKLPEKTNNLIQHLEDYKIKLGDTSQTISGLKELETGNPELEKLAEFARKNLEALNMVLELELSDANSNLRVLNKFYGDLVNPFIELDLLVEKIPDFKQGLTNLKNKVETLENTLSQKQAS